MADKKPVIKGNIRYFAYYRTLRELREDEDVSPDYLVTLITNQICTDYVIEESPGSNAVKLNNGYYANPIYSGNSLADTVSQLYSTEGPITYKIGGIEVGDEFSSLTVTEILNKMFYGSAVIECKLETNLTDPVHVRGERHDVTELKINVIKTKKKIVKQEVYVNDVLYEEYYNEWDVGYYSIPVEISFIDPITIGVTLRDEDGNAVHVEKEEKMMYPIFYSIVQPNFGATGNAIKRMNEVRSLQNLTHIVTTQNTCVFIAIAEEEEVIADITDENNLHIEEIYERGTVQVVLGEKVVSYTTYKSYALSTDELAITYRFKEVT